MRFVPAAAGILIILVRITYSYWPPVWPDEALFSSPAAELAAGRPFSTPVLSGLVPGMEKATLWNSPLYMLLLSGVSVFTGESLSAGRSFSLLVAVASLFMFAACLRLTTRSRLILFLGLAALAADPTFFRAANVIRMDVLTLFFFLSCLYFLLRRFAISDAEPQNRQVLWTLLAGAMTGLAALSHPAAIMLVPVLVIFLWPDIRHTAIAGMTAVLVLSAWLVYILPNAEIFHQQFTAQLTRKGSMFQLWGGDTGGIFVVFLSQYGAGKLGMLLMAGVISWTGCFFLYRWFQKRCDPLTVRLGFVFASVLGLVLFLSEGWYAVYVGPVLLLLAARLTHSEGEDVPFWKSPARLTTASIGLVFAVCAAVMFVQKSILQNVPAAVRRMEDRVVSDLKACRSVYVRYRPDPYFLLRARSPETEVLEFIPGKLRLPDPASLRTRYDSIHCFLLDDHSSWEPYLTAYLEAAAPLFDTVRLDYRPLESATLWVRKPDRLLK